MQRLSAITAFVALVAAGSGPLRAAPCADPAAALGVARVVEIDTSGGPLYGAMSHREKEPDLLAPGEVVLTFDDGPSPRVTNPILDTLDRFCTRATFFSVGEMALAYPATVKEVAARGHTLGTHTWSHPLNLRRLSLDKATDQIERGFAAVALAAGRPIAPFFRFPGLSDSDALLSHLQTRSVASFTVDVVSNDSFVASSVRITQTTLRQAEARRGGILLFHDIKPATAKALPAILAGLRDRGFRVVHLVAKAPMTPIARYANELGPLLAKRSGKTPIEAAPAADIAAALPRAADGAELPLTRLAPVARARLVAATEPEAAPPPAAPSRSRAPHKAHRRSGPDHADAPAIEFQAVE